MKKKAKSFGFVFPINKGEHVGKFFFSFKDKEGLNQHSKLYNNVEDCSQDFAVKFAQYIVDRMNASINSPEE